MRLVTKIFSNMLVFSRAKMRLVVSQPKKRKKIWDWLFKKINLVWKNMNLPRRFLFKHICTSHMTSLFLMSHFSTFQILSPLTRSSSSPHLLYFLPFSRSIFSSFSSLFPLFFFFYHAYSDFLLHLLLCLFFLNEWSPCSRYQFCSALILFPLSLFLSLSKFMRMRKKYKIFSNV